MWSENETFFENSEKTRVLVNQVRHLKGHHANVLITGETGTGKELLARELNRQEENPKRPFIAFNCAAIPENLIESELFGYERGAFTGAAKRHIGKFELANGGDIFLDEISILKKDIQAKILRVLEEKEFYRVGGNTLVRSNFRVLCATNESLKQKVMKDEFRPDLYYRLCVVEIVIPPLRERIEDIEPLLDLFCKRYSPDRKKSFSKDAIKHLVEHNWPGNVRELKNLVENLIIMTDEGVIEPKHLPQDLRLKDRLHTSISASSELHESRTLKEFVDKAERDFIGRIINECGGDKIEAARQLKIGRTTLYEKMQKLRLVS
jgi:transcriptional regulator with PAS, ATPase and Fis domain